MQNWRSWKWKNREDTQGDSKGKISICRLKEATMYQEKAIKNQQKLDTYPHILMKLQNFTHKEKILKAAKAEACHLKNKTRLTSDFSTVTLNARRQRSSICAKRKRWTWHRELFFNAGCHSSVKATGRHSQIFKNSKIKPFKTRGRRNYRTLTIIKKSQSNNFAKK